jgi:uncharacterized cupredoxin-like copper-binding protein
LRSQSERRLRLDGINYKEAFVGLLRLRSLLFSLSLVMLVSACGGDDHGGAHGGTGAGAGAPATGSDSDRTVEVEAQDTLRFEPAEVEVAAGDTITFSVTNAGDLEHEFVIGEHGDSMDGDMSHGDEALVLEGGETGEVTWTFTEAGELGFACYIDGHNASGMEGTILIAE